MNCDLGLVEEYAKSKDKLPVLRKAFPEDKERVFVMELLVASSKEHAQYTKVAVRVAFGAGICLTLALGALMKVLS
jgi:hypothetical protein